MQHPIVAVTGAAGFIGRHLVDRLVAEGHKVRVVDLPRHLVGERAHPTVEVRPADLRNPVEAAAALKGSDICIALAARSAGLGYFNCHPATMLHDNSLITSNTFGALREHCIHRVIYISSSCVFERATSHVATEELLQHTPAPSPGYPFSKLLGEAYCRAFAAEFGISFTILRPFNVYGPGELTGSRWGDGHVIPDLLEKILLGIRPIPIFGSGQQTRSFTYVADIVAGIIRALEFAKTCHNEDFNLGRPEETSIEVLLQLLWNMTGHPGQPPTELQPSFRVDPPRRSIDMSKAQRLLGWHPTISLREGLEKYIAWYRAARVAVDATARSQP